MTSWLVGVMFIHKLGFNVNLNWRETFIGSEDFFFNWGDIEVAIEVVIHVCEGVVLVAVVVGPGQQHVALAEAASTLPL